MPKRTRDHDAWLVERLSEPEVAANYLSGVLDEAPEKFLEALGEVARAYQMKKLAMETGLTRESLYRSLSSEGNPTAETIEAVFRALNLEYSGVRVRVPTLSSTGKAQRKQSNRKNRVRVAPNGQLAFPFGNIDAIAPEASLANTASANVPSTWDVPSSLINAHYSLSNPLLRLQQEQPDVSFGVYFLNPIGLYSKG